MQSHGGVEVGLGRLHFDGDAEHLHDFSSAVSDDMASDHAIGRAIDEADMRRFLC